MVAIGVVVSEAHRGVGQHLRRLAPAGRRRHMIAPTPRPHGPAFTRPRALRWPPFTRRNRRTFQTGLTTVPSSASGAGWRAQLAHLLFAHSGYLRGLISASACAGPADCRIAPRPVNRCHTHHRRSPPPSRYRQSRCRRSSPGPRRFRCRRGCRGPRQPSRPRR